MTDTELLAALGKLRGQVAQMTPGPWEWRWKGNELRSLSDRGEYTYGSLVACIRDDDDGVPMISEPNADGIAALRNVADELFAAVEAAGKLCSAAHCINWHNTGRAGEGMIVSAEHVRKLWDARGDMDAALAALAKKLEATDVRTT